MKRPFLKLSTILLIIVVFSIFLDKTKLIVPLKNLAQNLVSPIQKRFYNFGAAVGEKLSPFFIKKDLIEENKELQTRLAKLYKENAELKLKEKDYQILKTQIEFLDKKDYQYVLAQVIGKAPLGQILILNKGHRDGLKENLPVVVGKGFLIGKLIKVNENTSQVLLLLDHQSRVAALVQSPIGSEAETPGLPDATKVDTHQLVPTPLPKSETSIPGSAMGVVRGEYNLSLIMDLVPLDKKIGLNDPVITSGLESDVPAGLLIGYIDRVEANPGQLFQKATVKPLIDFEGLRIVTIVLPS